MPKKTRRIIEKKGQFQVCREYMAKTFNEDKGTAQAYEANIACLLMDHYNRVDFRLPGIRNAAANEIMKLIFDLPSLSAQPIQLPDDLEGDQAPRGI